MPFIVRTREIAGSSSSSLSLQSTPWATAASTAACRSGPHPSLTASHSSLVLVTVGGPAFFFFGFREAAGAEEEEKSAFRNLSNRWTVQSGRKMEHYSVTHDIRSCTAFG